MKRTTIEEFGPDGKIIKRTVTEEDDGGLGVEPVPGPYIIPYYPSPPRPIGRPWYGDNPSYILTIT